MRAAILLFSGAVLAASTALAQEDAGWWHGGWAKTGVGCTASQILTLTAQLWQTENGGCDILDASSIPGLNATRLSLACPHEGDIYNETHLLMKADGGLWIWYGGEAPVYFRACSEHQEN